MEIKRHYRPTRVKKYEARWYVDGKAKTRFFTTEEEREQFIGNFSEQVARNGTDLLLGFNAAQMRRWQEASRLLLPMLTRWRSCGSGSLLTVRRSSL